MHHATLKSAVAAYLVFHTGGASAEEVKAEIAKDPKAFDEAGINEIYDAILVEAGDKEKSGEKPGGTDKGKTGKTKHIVVKPFRDINNFDKQFNPGDDVSGLDATRLENLVTKGLVEIK